LKGDPSQLAMDDPERTLVKAADDVAAAAEATAAAFAATKDIPIPPPIVAAELAATEAQPVKNVYIEASHPGDSETSQAQALLQEVDRLFAEEIKFVKEAAFYKAKLQVAKADLEALNGRVPPADARGPFYGFYYVPGGTLEDILKGNRQGGQWAPLDRAKLRDDIERLTLRANSAMAQFRQAELAANKAARQLLAVAQTFRTPGLSKASDEALDLLISRFNASRDQALFEVNKEVQSQRSVNPNGTDDERLKLAQALLGSRRTKEALLAVVVEEDEDEKPQCADQWRRLIDNKMDDLDSTFKTMKGLASVAATNPPPRKSKKKCCK